MCMSRSCIGLAHYKEKNNLSSVIMLNMTRNDKTEIR